jgi:polysaccharide export outer membrane protein
MDNGNATLPAFALWGYGGQAVVAEKRMKRIALVLALVLAAADHAAGQVNNYIVGPSDVLAITVFDQADLGGKFAVEADGTFTFPLIGRLKAGGLTLREIEESLRRELSNGFFKNPQVSVAVEQYRSQRVFIVGEVKNAGTYALTGDMTLIEALARAGSATEAASGEALIVRSKTGAKRDGPVLPDQDEGAEVIRVDIKELQSGKLSQNAQLQDNDTIFVPRAELVYVFGQVKNPGAYPLQKGTTVLQALSLAGGVTDRGATGRIRVARVVRGTRIELKIRLEDVVRAGDTIIVPERFF